MPPNAPELDPRGTLPRMPPSGADERRATNPTSHSAAHERIIKPVHDPLALRRLCEAASAGDETAFAALHRRLDAGLKRFFLKRTLGQDDLADELTQKTWVAVWQALRAGRYDASRAAISTFLYGVGYKLWLQHCRQSRRPQSTDEVDELAQGLLAQDDPAQFLRACELLDAVRDCLRAEGTPYALAPDEREIVEATMGGESERAVAARLGLAASTINARKQVAFQKLRMCLNRKGHGGLPEREGPGAE